MDGEVIGASISILVVLLSLIIYLLLRLDRKLDNKQDKDACQRQLRSCEKLFDAERFWTEFNNRARPASKRTGD
jgi:hypothetical protein